MTLLRYQRDPDVFEKNSRFSETYLQRPRPSAKCPRDACINGIAAAGVTRAASRKQGRGRGCVIDAVTTFNGISMNSRIPVFLKIES